MRYYFAVTLLFLIGSCNEQKTDQNQEFEAKTDLSLSLTQAERLASLPLKCIQQEYPNKLGQVLNNSNELKSPKKLHPAFYGCFDWHSSVHGHWLMVRLLKQFPSMKNRELIRKKLREQLTEVNIQQELAFFQTKYNESFERTYGWAWLLKLHQELLSWNDAEGQEWARNLNPLCVFIVEKYEVYLPKLHYPIRTGEHINTAFGLCFALDYARETKNNSFENNIIQRAKDFYLKDVLAPLSYEPSGYDFLSPTFEEIDLMRRVLSASEFENWLNQFLPELTTRNFKLQVGVVSDRTDGKMVHLDGLNFSRAWCLYGLSRTNPKYAHLRKNADEHLQASIGSIVDGDYMGEHWLASFALMALLEREVKLSKK
jgi:hypothetical protein